MSSGTRLLHKQLKPQLHIRPWCHLFPLQHFTRDTGCVILFNPLLTPCSFTQLAVHRHDRSFEWCLQSQEHTSIMLALMIGPQDTTSNFGKSSIICRPDLQALSSSVMARGCSQSVRMCCGHSSWQITSKFALA